MPYFYLDSCCVNEDCETGEVLVRAYIPKDQPIYGLPRAQTFNVPGGTPVQEYDLAKQSKPIHYPDAQGDLCDVYERLFPYFSYLVKVTVQFEKEKKPIAHFMSLLVPSYNSETINEIKERACCEC